MKRKQALRFWYFWLVAALGVAVLVGCGAVQATPDTASTGEGGAYTSAALDTSYDGALDVSAQLALGTLRLEQAGDGVTPEQAAILLPLWQAMQGGTLQGDAELNATLAYVEETMTPVQSAAIGGMRLTQDDLQTWMQEQGRGFGGGQGTVAGEALDTRTRPELLEGEMDPEMAARRAEFESMSEEERAAMREEMEASGGRDAGAGGGVGAGEGQFAVLTESLVDLLSERAASGDAGRSEGAAAVLPIATPNPSVTPVVTSVVMPATMSEVAPTVALTVTEPITPTQVVTEVVASAPSELAQTAHVSPVAPASAAVVSLDLPRIPESGPRPPFTISVDSISTTDDGTIKLTGTVRNDGTETYEGVRVWGTFYIETTEYPEEKVSLDRSGMPGQGEEIPTETEGAQDGSPQEVLRPYGPVEVVCPYPYLEPGAACPFTLEMYPRDYDAYHLGATGEPVDEYRQSAPVVLSDVSVSRDAVGYVRITGTVTNGNPFNVRNATITGTLLDANGQVVGVGSAIVLGDLAPGSSERFDLRVEYEPYVQYQLHAQSTQS